MARQTERSPGKRSLIGWMAFQRRHRWRRHDAIQASCQAAASRKTFKLHWLT